MIKIPKSIGAKLILSGPIFAGLLCRMVQNGYVQLYGTKLERIYCSLSLRNSNKYYRIYPKPSAVAATVVK